MQRILVLGSAPHSRNVDAYAWDSLPSPLTVADYDVVILNLVPLSDGALCARCDLATFPSAFDFGKLIFSRGSTLVFVGSPKSREFPSQPGAGANSISRIDPSSWLPKAPAFEFDSGEAIRKVTEYEWYFEKVRRWSFYADRHFVDREMPQVWYDRIGFPRANVIRAGLTSCAETRFGRAIAFALRYELWLIENLPGLINRGRQHKEKLSDSGSVVWLPPPTEITDYEAVNLILAERFKIAVEQEPPAWARVYMVPRQVDVQSCINELNRQMQDKLTQLDTAIADLDLQQRYSRLIYEQGDPLEHIVWSVFDELGARVEPPTDRGKHDGRLVDPNGRHAALEIKGRTKAIGLTDVRQCEQWKQDAIVETKQEFKGLLIGNAHCGVRLEKRDDWFAPNAVDLAQQYRISLIKTSALFRAIQDLQNGAFDRDAFWDAVFSANGECALPDVAVPPTSTE